VEPEKGQKGCKAECFGPGSDSNDSPDRDQDQVVPQTDFVYILPYKYVLDYGFWQSTAPQNAKLLDIQVIN